jgi:hypothetical protein
MQTRGLDSLWSRSVGRRRVAMQTLLAASLSALCAMSCIMDDDRCGKHQVQDPDSDRVTCVCEPGYIISPRAYGCEACGEHEEVLNGKCECEPGYARRAPTSACEPQTGSLLGSECSDDQPCFDPNPYCANTADGSFCTTRGCEVNDDCPAQWRCAESESGKFCTKPPRGFLMHCESHADCADTEARFCETFREHVCIVSGCAAHPAVCPSQMVCCDLSALIGDSVCVASATLENGACPGGAPLVTP